MINEQCKLRWPIMYNVVQYKEWMSLRRNLKMFSLAGNNMAECFAAYLVAQTVD